MKTILNLPLPGVGVFVGPTGALTPRGLGDTTGRLGDGNSPSSSSSSAIVDGVVLTVTRVFTGV